ncbi:aldo/keto reductase [Salipiger marinus]|uniref:aldo/keto reductase n=1 Tax=Salipiger marinus TaxID=555512 RepID=UPI001E2E3416|nr:aldo/keto reductase [Salipiger manganoxidans]MCD1617986.1 aldo/keto reductase [Salipiger manganoxidans]MEB3418662.1 aldo/keto reductase [Salipiger manganoxidans]
MTALGLGPFLTFDLLPGAPRAPLREVVARVAAGVGGVVDTSPLYGSAEVSLGAIMSEMPEARDIFVANKIWSTGDYLGDTSHATASLDQSKLRMWRPVIGLMQCHSMTNAGVVLPLMQAWKSEGQIGHVGVTHHESSYQAELTGFIERGGCRADQPFDLQPLGRGQAAARRRRPGHRGLRQPAAGKGAADACRGGSPCRISRRISAPEAGRSSC